MNEELTSIVGRHLRSWATGRPPEIAPTDASTSTIVLEDARHLPDLRESGVVGDQTVVLVPDRQNPGLGERVVGYDGSFSEPGSDIAIEQTIFVQSQDYSTSPYMTLVGTTLIRITGDADFEEFLADADLAFEQGRFREFAVSPAVAIADLTSLGEATQGDAPRIRLYVDHEGRVSTAPGGLPLGMAGDRLNDIVTAWTTANQAGDHPCAVGLGTIVSEDLRSAALAERPWLGRYLQALDLHRHLAGRGIGEVRVSGFGGRLSAAGDADLRGLPVPLLAWTPDTCYLRAPGSGRLFGLGRQAAELAELLLVSGGIEAAAEHAERARLDQVAAYLDTNGMALTAPYAGALA